MPDRGTGRFVFLANCVGFNLTYGMITLLVPLYAVYLGYTPLEIGLVVSAIGYVQFIARLTGGVLADWLGERRILFASSGSMAVSGLLFHFAGASIVFLIAAQMLSGLARAAFWSPGQSYASRMGGALSGAVIARNSSYFNISTSVGYLLGLILAGAIPSVSGYPTAITVFTVLAAGSTVCWFAVRELPGAGSKSQGFKESFSGLGKMVRVPPLYLSGLCAFMAGASTSLVGSFYPIYMGQIGLAAYLIGVVSSARNVGLIGGNLIFSRLLPLVPGKYLSSGMIAFFGLCIAGVYLVREPILMTVLLLITGFFAGGLGLYNITLAGEHTEPRRRGVAMSFTGAFWSIALVVTPIVFGGLSEVMPLATTFVVVGLAIVAIGVTTAPLHAALVPETREGQRRDLTASPRS